MSLVVAIIGRPNVGKSTLFNRLTGRKSALVDSAPGVTRDRREGKGSLGGLEFNIIDTAGYEEGNLGSLQERMWRQTEKAVLDADVVFLVIDARSGITPLDMEFSKLVRSTNKPVVLIANKCESSKSDSGYYESFSLSLGEPVAISAEHGLGFAEVYKSISDHISLLQNYDQKIESGRSKVDETIRLVIIGKPNVGKSTLINRLIGNERVITGPEPGLTRDSIEIEWKFEGRNIHLFDTAGLRRRPKVTEKLDKISTADTISSIGRANVAVLVLDSTVPIGRADLYAANIATENGKAIVIALNKLDLLSDSKKIIFEINQRLKESLPQVKDVPVVAFSALSGFNVNKLMPLVTRTYDLWNTRIKTSILNRWLYEINDRHPPPSSQGRKTKLRYITQSSARPPTFILFSNNPRLLNDSWIRFATNDLRKAFNLPGIPIRFKVRRSRDTR